MMDNIDPASIVALVAMLAVVVVSVLALTKDMNTSLRIQLNENTSVDFETQGLAYDETKVDCLPGSENSQLCDS